MITLGIDLLRSRRTLLLAICSGLFVVCVGYLALYPSFADQLETFASDLPDAYKALIGDADITSPEGYIRTQVYSLLAPLLIAGAAISAGSGLARAERDKTLAVLTVLPIRRARVAGAWWLLVVAVCAIAAVVTIVGVLIGGPLAGATVTFDRVALATLPMALFGVAMGTIALTAAATTGAPGAATGAGWLAVVISFLGNSLAELVDDLDWLASISPWSWHGAGEAITGPFDVGRLALLVLLTAVASAAALWGFERRDLHL